MQVLGKFLKGAGSIWTLLFLSGLNLIFMHYYIFLTYHLNAEVDFAFFVDNILGVFFDVLIIFSLVYLVSLRKIRVALSISFAITWLWSLSSVMYSRFFFHYLSLSAVWQGGALTDDLIFQCIKANIQILDLFYPCVAVLFVYILKHSRLEASMLFVKKLFTFFLFFVFCDLSIHAIYCLANPSFRYVSYYIHRLHSNHFVEHVYYSQPNLAHFLRGEIRTLGAELVKDLEGNIELSRQQVEEINQFISKSRHRISDNSNINSKSNIIFILVESYMSFTSDLKIGGKEVTPFLNSLKRDSTVYYNGNMKTNVTLGGSSDGQFIYMTGLLPLRSVLTISKARNAAMPGLPKILGMSSRMVIPTVTSIWDQDQMCRQYGFDELYASDDFSSQVNGNLTDEQVFQLAMQIDKASRQPFFSIILTISMHQPYIEQIDSTFPIHDTSITDELANYLNACHYTDRQIGNYFAWLKKSGLYDNSMIVIAADHPVDNTDFGGVANDIPLYIVNAGVSNEKMWQGEHNQVDLYTTLLDLFGCESNWYGLGNSLASPQYENMVSPRTWEMSERIIMGNFFSKKYADGKDL